MPLAQDKLTLLQSEYDLLLKKLQHFCACKTRVRNQTQQNDETMQKSALMTQYHELEAAWENQKQAWLALNARLLKASFS